MRECVPGLLRASWPRHAAHRPPDPGTAALSYPPQGSADRALAGLWVPVLPPRQGRCDSHRQDGSHRGSHARASGGCAQTLNEVCGMFSFSLIINCSRVQWTLLTQLVRGHLLILGKGKSDREHRSEKRLNYTFCIFFNHTTQ